MGKMKRTSITVVRWLKGESVMSFKRLQSIQSTLNEKFFDREI